MEGGNCDLFSYFQRQCMAMLEDTEESGWSLVQMFMHRNMMMEVQMYQVFPETYGMNGRSIGVYSARQERFWYYVGIKFMFAE